MYTTAATYGTEQNRMIFGEKSDHLGNVRAVVSDIRKPASTTGSIDTWTWQADITDHFSYYPFGMLEPGRQKRLNTVDDGGYRFSAFGYERDDEIAGSGNYYDMGARLYDARIARTPTRDPMWSNFPSESDYIYAGNNPIYYIANIGESKYSYITLVDNDGTETTIVVVDDKYIEYDWVRETDWFDYQWETYRYNAYDIEEHIKISRSSGEVLSYTVKKHKRDRAWKDWVKRKIGYPISEFENKMSGGGEKIKGGLYLTSEDGGVDPTKTISLTEAEMIDVTEMLAAVAAKTKSLKIPDVIQSHDLTKAATDLASQVIPKSKPNHSSAINKIETIPYPVYSKEKFVKIMDTVTGNTVGEMTINNVRYGHYKLKDGTEFLVPLKESHE